MTPDDLLVDASRLALVLVGCGLLMCVIALVEPVVRAIFGGGNDPKIRPQESAEVERGGGVDPAANHASRHQKRRGAEGCHQALRARKPERKMSMGWFTRKQPNAKEPKPTAEEIERRRKHLKAMQDFADGLPKPGPDGIVPRRK